MPVVKIPLILEPQVEGGYTVTSPALPELVTEGDSIHEALRNADDALDALFEAFQTLGRPLPAALATASDRAPISVETAVAIR